MPEHDDRLLVTERGVRNAFVASGVGMVALLVLFLVLATAQPQGVYQTADDSQYRATLTAAAEDLEGFELVGDDGARIDIDHAMDLVLERGVGLSMTSLLPDQPPPMAAAPSEPAAPSADAAADEAAADVAPSDEAPAAEAAGEDVVARFAAATDADGEAVYANCTSCHQANGAGIPGAFPPLSGGHTAELARVEGGRAYLVNALLYGLQGPLEVEGATYNGVMPAWPQLDDDQIAAVLNYTVTAWDNADALPDGYAPFTAEEVASGRGQGLSGADALATRPDPSAPIAPTPGADDAPASEAAATSEDAAAPSEPATADVAAAAAPTGGADLLERLAAATETTGDAAYANCTSCHQANGSGIAGAFPPLSGGHGADIALAEGGRTYLVHAMLYGVQGSMMVEGVTYNGVMPGWQQLSDDVIAAALNHAVSAWDNVDALPADFEPFTPEQIATERGLGLAASQVLESRPPLR